VIMEHTNLKVVVGHGQSDSGWNAHKWKTETSRNEVLSFYS